MKIYGHLVVSNEHPADVLRAIESIFPICDEILVVGDGTNQSLEDFLEARKDIYNLKIWQNAFVTVREQRQFLINQTPVGNWVVALDADEAYSMETTRTLRDCLLNQLSQKHYDAAREGNVPLVINVPVCNLVGNPIHYDGDGVYHSQKIFFYESGLHWAFDQYFCHITYKNAPMAFEEGGDTTVYSIIGKKEWILKHYARLSPERLKWRAQHVGDPKYGKYEKDAWQKSGKTLVPLGVEKW